MLGCMQFIIGTLLEPKLGHFMLDFNTLYVRMYAVDYWKAIGTQFGVTLC